MWLGMVEVIKMQLVTEQGTRLGMLESTDMVKNRTGGGDMVNDGDGCGGVVGNRGGGKDVVHGRNGDQVYGQK